MARLSRPSVPISRDVKQPEGVALKNVEGHLQQLVAELNPLITDLETTTTDHAGRVSTLETAPSVPGVMTAKNATAPPAGGTSVVLFTTAAGGLGLYAGSGVPSVTAAQGSVYFRTDGNSTSTRFYVRGASGWIAVTTAT